jgi:hypothetical protein
LWLLDTRRTRRALDAAGTEPQRAAQGEEEVGKARGIASTRCVSHKMYRLRS